MCFTTATKQFSLEDISKGGMKALLSSLQKEVEAGQTVLVNHKAHTYMNGVVVKMITDKGFGFIQPEGGEKDLFFHARSVVGDVVYDDLKEGDKVTFETEDGPKGPSAVNVEKVA